MNDLFVAFSAKLEAVIRSYAKQMFAFNICLNNGGLRLIVD